MPNNKEYFNSIARDYNKTHVGKNSDKYLEICVNAMRPLLNRPILEVGCGTGRATKLIKPDMATDFSPEMVKQVKGARVADVHDLPFKDDEFNTVACLALLQHCEKPIAAIREMLRVGKRLLTVVTIFPKYEKITEPFLVHHFSRAFFKNLLRGFQYRMYELPIKNSRILKIDK